jgi:Fe/S biogenesis protein NfuA
MPDTVLNFSEKAREKVLEFMEGAEDRENLAIRVNIAGQGPQGFEYEFFLDVLQNARPNDIIVEVEGGLVAILDAASAPHLDGATVNWKETVSGSGFDVDNPNPVPEVPLQPETPQADLTTPIAQAVQKVIDAQINPGVASHGGFVELMDVQGDKAFVRLGGGCQGCGMVDVTLKQGIEVMIREEIPEITQVIDTTDHAGGNNPYYQPSK